LRHIASLVATFIVTAGFIHRFRALALRVNLSDSGGGRKAHSDNVPVIGGVAILVGFMVGIMILEPSLRSVGLKTLLAGLVLIGFVGLMDDLHEFNARAKLIWQAATAAGLTYFSGTTIASLGTLISDVPLVLNDPILRWVFTTVCLIGVMNAVNMTDGIDGLAGSLSFIALSSLAIFAGFSGLNELSLLLQLFAAAVLGFLWFNFPHGHRPNPRTFLGDCGALMIGLFVGWACVSITQLSSASASIHKLTPIGAVWVLGVFLLDLFGTLTLRLYLRRHPMHADRLHIHHLCILFGMSTTQTTLALSSLAISFAVFAWFAPRIGISDSSLLLLAFLLLLTYVFAMAHLLKRLPKGVLENHLNA
jgi:UDP-GlcNAc:undecaprenyl-phosphate/decaprenyl-phosphate GlcNAc-1-phosphate transferase